MRRIPGLCMPVAAVVFAIIYIYFTSLFVFIGGWFGLKSSQGIMNAIAFTATAFMCVYNYALAIYTDPGQVPPYYSPYNDGADITIQEVKRSGGALRYCQKCTLPKPPRAHHCRVCRRCVLRMDHHCIWINNCVGHANYKVFLLFIMYAGITCIYSMVLLFGSLSMDLQEDELQTDSCLRSIYVISGLLLFPLSLALGGLLGWHIYLITQNKTTIEYHEGVRAIWLAATSGDLYKHPYDLGTFENLTSVLGPDMFFWVCPTSWHIGSGLRFRTDNDDNPVVEVIL